MRLLRFSRGDHWGFGVLRDGDVHDLSGHVSDLRSLVSVAAASGGSGVIDEWCRSSPSFPHEEVVPRAPVDVRSRVFCAARNFLDHVQEVGRKVGSQPLMFLKLPSSMIDPHAPIRAPAVTSHLDYEGEVAVVIGRGGASIPASRALEHVLGVTALNDVSARDLQRRKEDGGGATMDWFSGKALDATTPVGPLITTLDEIADLDEVRVTSTLNGAVTQKARVADMIFSIPELISYLSERVALEPMDVIATGTPGKEEGHRGRRLEAGDVVEVEVTGVGSLRNTVE